MHTESKRRLFGTLLLFALCGLPSVANEYGTFIDWANLDGTSVQTVFEPSGYCQGLALDSNAGKLYFTDTGKDLVNPAGFVGRVNLDGSNIETIIVGPDHVSPNAIALDPAGGKMYWSDGGARTVRRANLDGSDIETLIYSTPDSLAIALDLQNGKMYLGGLYEIRRANLDGTGFEVLFHNDGLYLGLALDVANDKMYWASAGGQIGRANLDGSDIEVLIDNASSPQDIDLDLAQGKMYWTDRISRDVRRANLSGSDVEILIGGARMGEITLDPVRGKMYVSGRDREVEVPAVSARGAVILATLMFFGVSSLLVRRVRT